MGLFFLGFLWFFLRLLVLLILLDGDGCGFDFLLLFLMFRLGFILIAGNIVPSVGGWDREGCTFSLGVDLCWDSL